MLKTFNPLPTISKGYYFQMAPKKKTTSYSPKEILDAQREFAQIVSNKIGFYTEHQVQMMLNNNTPEDATDFFFDYFLRQFTRLHFFFFFHLTQMKMDLYLPTTPRLIPLSVNNFFWLNVLARKQKLSFQISICR